MSKNKFEGNLDDTVDVELTKIPIVKNLEGNEAAHSQTSSDLDLPGTAQKLILNEPI